MKSANGEAFEADLPHPGPPQGKELVFFRPYEGRRLARKKIRIVFTTSLAIQKFQKFQSVKFKRSLSYQFDRDAALDELTGLYNGDQDVFFTKHFRLLAYYVRKFNLTFEDFAKKLTKTFTPNLVDNLRKVNGISSDDDLARTRLLCSAFKFLIRNSKGRKNPIGISTIAALCERPLGGRNNESVITELLMCYVHNLDETEMDKHQSECQELLSALLKMPSLTADSKAFFIGKLDRKRDRVDEENVRDDEDLDELRMNDKSVVPRKVKKNQQAVSKTIQTVRARQQTTTQSEEEQEANFDFLKKTGQRNRATQQAAMKEDDDADEDESKSGNDQSFWKTTWPQVLQLYSTSVIKGDLLKEGDKNRYLPSKFLGTHYYFSSLTPAQRKVCSFFINRMCTAMFLKASKKQRLESSALKRLTKCVVDFDGLLNLLDLNRKKIEESFFVKTIVGNYSGFMKYQEPSLAKDFIRQIADVAVEKYTVKGWFSTSIEGREKESYDKAKIEAFIIDEINQVRVEAVKALYHSALRDKTRVLTKKRLKIIGDYAETREDGVGASQVFKDHIFKLINLARTLDDFDYQRMFNAYHNQLRHNFQRLGDEELKVYLEFMTDQVRDVKRAQELFTTDTLTTFIQICLPNVTTDAESSRRIMEIVNIYLEHEKTTPLTEVHLTELVEICQTTAEVGGNVVLVRAILTALLYSTDKSRRWLERGWSKTTQDSTMLSQNFLDKLVGLYTALMSNEDCASFLVFMLNRFLSSNKDLFVSAQDVLQHISNKMHGNSVIEINDDDDDKERIGIVPDGGDNNCDFAHKISYHAAQILLRSVEKRVRLTSVTVDNLIIVLSGNNQQLDEKQTCITAAKCLDGVTKYVTFDKDDYLDRLLDLFESATIYDVGVHLRAAYARGCDKVAAKELPSCLKSIHLDSMSKAFVSAEALRLGRENYKEDINENVLNALLQEAKKEKSEFKDPELFRLFDDILGMNENYAPKVLQILSAYSYAFTLPIDTVRILENLLSVSGHFEAALSVLRNVILDGKVPVTSKTFDVYSGYLRSSVNARRRFDSFKLVEKAGRKQELPDDIFCQSELVRAAYALDLTEDEKIRRELMAFFQRSVESGVRLPMDAKIALKRELHDETVLNILATMAKNKEILEPRILTKLEDMFDPTDQKKDAINIALIKIFEYASKNNQNLQGSLLTKLNTALKEKRLKEEVLPVFIYLAQKGETLSHYVMSELIGRLMNKEESGVWRQELLSALGSLIEANHHHQGAKDLLIKVNKILVREMRSDSRNVQKLCLKVVRKLVGVTKRIDDNLLEELVTLGTDTNKSNDALRFEVRDMFKTVITDDCNPLLLRKKGYRWRIELANLNVTSPENLLAQLQSYRDTEGGGIVLIDENYRQLKGILDDGRSSQLSGQVLDLLHSCKSKSAIADELLDSVAILYESTMSEALKRSCLRLLDDAVTDGKQLGGRAHDVWGSKRLKDKRLKNFLKGSAAKKLRQLKIEPEDLFGLVEDDSEKLADVNKLPDLIDLILTARDLEIYSKNESFVDLIEQVLLKHEKKALHLALPCYCLLVQERRECNMACLEALARKSFAKGRWDAELAPDFFEALLHASELSQLPDACLQIVKDNVGNEDERVRGFAFGIMRRDVTCKSILIDYCKIIVTSVMAKVGGTLQLQPDEDLLDLLETIVSVRYLDTQVFEETKRLEWRTELLLSDVCAALKAQNARSLPMHKVQVYTSWLSVREKFTAIESVELASLIHKCSFQDHGDLIELLSMIPDLDFDETRRTLLTHRSTPSEAMKSHWTRKKLNLRLSKAVEQTYSKKLIKKLCTHFSCDCIGGILDRIETIENLFAFEDILEFCLKESISADAILGGKVGSLKELRHSIECKYLHRLARPKTAEKEVKFARISRGLKEIGWTFEHLRDFVQTFVSIGYGFENMSSFLNTILSYSLAPSNLERCKDILEKSRDFEDVMKNLNGLVVENHFQSEGKVKDLNELLAEIAAGDDRDLSKAVADGDFDVNKHIFEGQKEKLEWTEKPILVWAKHIKDTGQTFTDYEGIAVVLRANNLITGHTLTHTQILCCLIALRGDRSKLLQVATGEGKSTITCILAIINALRGKKVDVITSSPVLAERDAKEKAQLYRYFNLTCADNNDKTVYVKGKKDCYDADVVYGEMSQFQFDILRDNYSKLGTLGDRVFAVAVVDEVDSMLIDDGSKIARLSATVPGMDHFQVGAAVVDSNIAPESIILCRLLPTSRPSTSSSGND